MKKNLTLIVTNNISSPIIIGDQIRFSQVVLDLIQNAIKFTDKGGIEISLSQILIDAEFCEISLDINDTGIGINPEDECKLFKAFSQLNPKRGGFGLGLYVCNRITSAMGGRLSTSHNQKNGTCMHFSAPFKIGKIIKEQKCKFEFPKKKYSGRVLVVEDNKMNQVVAEKLLTNLGFRVDIAPNGQIGLDMATRELYAIVFMDCQMPVMDGFVCTQEIRRYESHHPQTKNVIVAMTANVDHRKECFAKGMDDFISKPIFVDHLTTILDKYLLD